MNNTSVCNTTEILNSGPHVNQGFDVWLYLAYCCLLLSYININILIFRFWIVLSAVFFVVWGCVPSRAVQVDTLVFNCLFIIINIVQSIPLVKQIWPVKLKPLEEEIYERDFSGQMSKKQFKRFIDKFKCYTYQADNSQLCVVKSEFEHLIYIAKLNPGWKVNLRNDRNSSITELFEGSWVGTIEYMIDLERKETDPPVKWGISAILEKTNDKHIAINHNTEQGLISNEEAGCIIYIVKIKVSIIYLFPYFLL